jgi:hypothetical protein
VNVKRRKQGPSNRKRASPKKAGGQSHTCQAVRERPMVTSHDGDICSSPSLCSSFLNSPSGSASCPYLSLGDLWWPAEHSVLPTSAPLPSPLAQIHRRQARNMSKESQTTAPSQSLGPEYRPATEKPTATVSKPVSHKNVHILPQTPQLIALLT